MALFTPNLRYEVDNKFLTVEGAIFMLFANSFVFEFGYVAFIINASVIRLDKRGDETSFSETRLSIEGEK